MAVKMEFICNQDWNSMDVIQRGKFCQQCQREVIDFTRQTEKQILGHKKPNEKTCGLFTAEQVYDDIITPISLHPLRKYAAVAATLLALETSSVIAQQKDSVKTEQVQIWKPGGENKENICPVQDNIEIKFKPKEVHLFNTKKREYYLTKRFPFIHARYTRKHYVMGFFIQ
jgi:hypothetical protein